MSVPKTNDVKQEYDKRSLDAQFNRDLRKKNASCARVDFVVGQCTLICIAQYTGNESKLRVVDLACGQLGVYPKLLRFGMEFYLGVDNSQEALKEGESRKHSLTINPPRKAEWITDDEPQKPIVAKLACLDLNTQKIAITNVHEKFDLALCHNALHFLNAENIFENVSVSLLKPNGFFTVVCLNGDVMKQHFEEQKEYPYPEWFQISKLTSKDYVLTNLGLCTKVRESRLYLNELFSLATKHELVVHSSKSLWDIYQQYENQLHSRIYKPWPSRSAFTMPEQRLLACYHIFVFQKR
jgi:SAM-dependent methyltransferase